MTLIQTHCFIRGRANVAIIVQIKLIFNAKQYTVACGHVT